MFPCCLILKNDPTYVQGIPDLSVFYHDRYAMLEVKIDGEASIQPNQQYYIDWINNTGGFGRFIFPENEEVVLNELKEYFENA